MSRGCHTTATKKTIADHTWCGLLNVLKVSYVTLVEHVEGVFTATIENLTRQTGWRNLIGHSPLQYECFTKLPEKEGTNGNSH